MIVALIIKMIYGVVGAIYFVATIYADKFRKRELLRLYKVTNFSLAWCVSYWCITIFFNAAEKPPEAYEFVISFTPIFISSLITLRYIFKYT